MSTDATNLAVALTTQSAISTTTSLRAIATVAAAAAGSHETNDDPGNGECRLLGSFALVVQSALGLLAISSLVWKRHRERPQRPLKIWAFDASKQVVGSSLLHVANLLMSMLSAGQLTVNPVVTDAGEKYTPNPCSFYLLNLAIDTTIGIPILIVLLRVLTHAFSLTPLGEPRESIQSGHYGHPPKTTWWMKQSLIYFLGLVGMKLCVLFIFSVLPWISRVGDWALRWTEGNEALQVTFVMLLFPLIMNALQYYIIDSFIKHAKRGDQKSSGSGDDDIQGSSYGDSDESSDDLSFTAGDDEETLSKDAEEESTRTRPDDGFQKTKKPPGEQEETALLQPSDRDLTNAAPGLR